MVMGKFYCRISGPLGGRTVRGVRLTESFAGLTGLLVPLHAKKMPLMIRPGQGSVNLVSSKISHR